MKIVPLRDISMRFYQYGAAGYLSAVIALLAGCASFSPPPSTKLTTLRQYQDAINLSGRLSLRYQQNGNDQAVHGSFTWNQTSNHVMLNLLSPLGQTLATIEIGPGSAILKQADKPPFIASDVDLLTEQALGWPLPIAGLHDWLQGFGKQADGSPFTAQPYAEQNRFVTSDGWSLHYADWQIDEADMNAATRNIARPKRIDLSRQTQQAGPVSLRIVIDSWQER